LSSERQRGLSIALGIATRLVRNATGDDARKNDPIVGNGVATKVMAALPSSSVSELKVPNVPATIRIKRSDGSVVHVARDVLALTGLLHGRAGLRAEQIRSQLRWDKKTTTKAITLALAEKRITKTGQRRATTYLVA
jgi:hypothetical protein